MNENKKPETAEGERKSYGNLINTVLAVAFIALGVFIVVNADLFTTVLILIVGAGMVIYGAVNMIRFVVAKEKKNPELFINGIIPIALGIILLDKFNDIMDLVSVFVGLVILVSSVYLLIEAISVNKISGKKIWAQIIIAIIGIICAVLCILGKIIVPTAFMTLLGIVLIVFGAISLVGTCTNFAQMIIFKNEEKKKIADAKKAEKEAEKEAKRSEKEAKKAEKEENGENKE